MSVSVSPPTPRQFWKLCITSCHRRQPAGAAHKQTPAAPPASKRGEPRGAAPTNGRGEESPCRQRVPRTAARRFVSLPERCCRPRGARTVTGLRGPAVPGRGLPPPRPRFNGRHGVRFSLGERRVRPGPRGQSAAPRAGGARRELPRGPAKFAPRPPRGRSRPARL